MSAVDMLLDWYEDGDGGAVFREEGFDPFGLVYGDGYTREDEDAEGFEPGGGGVLGAVPAPCGQEGADGEDGEGGAKDARGGDKSKVFGHHRGDGTGLEPRPTMVVVCVGIFTFGSLRPYGFVVWGGKGGLRGWRRRP